MPSHVCNGQRPLELEPYVYQKLRDPRMALRFLRLLPRDEKSEIICEIFEEALDKPDPTSYEVLSFWTWNDPSESKTTIKVTQRSRAYGLQVPIRLMSALRALRYPDKDRVLWIDLVCIDQGNAKEKNQQFPMMATIYGNASQVCIWLGEPTPDSKQAIDFIETELLNLWNFDKLCAKPEMAPKWAALLRLIMRPWFCRRWVIQEIALAKKGLVCCGRDTITWRRFADAVSLVVEVEMATHGLSDIMKKHEILNHIPDSFSEVAALSANLVFRRSQDSGREGFLSLEHLVSTLSVFQATENHDTIYALLAIAKDTLPRAAKDPEFGVHCPGVDRLSTSLVSKPYEVDFSKPYVEICKDFVVFAICQSSPDKTLDILCRPWAPKLIRTAGSGIEKLPSWIRDSSGAPFKAQDGPSGWKIDRINADVLVGSTVTGCRYYTAAGTKQVNMRKLKFVKHEKFYSFFVEGFVLDMIEAMEDTTPNGSIPESWMTAGGWTNRNEDPPEEFWRTMVGNRGLGAARNPPVFYPTACREAARKGMNGVVLNAANLINYGTCSIVSQFLRRVKEVIWNRKLIRTGGWRREAIELPKRLGLAPREANIGDLICILYGCTVPVILRRIEKTHDEKVMEQQEEDDKLRYEAAYKIQQNWRARNETKEILAKSHQDENFSARRTASNSGIVPEIQNRGTRGEGFRAMLKRTLTPYTESWRNAYQRSITQVGHFRAAYTKFAVFAFPVLCVLRSKHGTDLKLEMILGTTLGVIVTLLCFGPWAEVGKARVRVGMGWDKESQHSAQSKISLVGDHYYELIGECYIHGIMDGEAIRYQDQGEIKAEVFELR